MLCCVVTMLIQIPSPRKGYWNLGDCIVLLSGWILFPLYGFLAAGLGSALADFFSGYYIVYAPAIFVSKGHMTLIAYYGCKILGNKVGDLPAKMLSSIVAEIGMGAGYFVFESLLYGFIPSIVNIPTNAAQGIVGLVLGLILAKIFEKVRL